MNPPAGRLRAAVHLGLYLILLTPLLVWSEFLFPHLTAKVLGFQILVEIVTAGSLLLFLVERGRQEKERHLPPRVSWLWLALASFLAYSLAASAVAVDLPRSLWGFVERQDGLVLLLHFFAWFAVLCWFYQRRDFASYANFSYWVSTAVALTALTEVFFARFYGVVPDWIKSVSSGRVSGVFNNPTALGPYLLFHFFYGFYYLRSVARAGGEHAHARGPQRKARVPRRSRARLLSAGVVSAQLLILLVIFLGQTRGVVLGLLGGLFVGALFLVLYKDADFWLRAAAAALLLALIAAPLIAWQVRDSDIVKGNPTLYRLLQFSAAADSSILTRLWVWRSALRGFQDHPVFGWGHDNAYYALNLHYDAQHVRFQPDFSTSEATWYDKSHNVVLDLLVEKGALGLVLFSLVVAGLGHALWKIPDRFLSISLASAFSGYAISNTAAFDSFGSFFGASLFLAYVNSPGPPTLKGSKSETRVPTRKARGGPARLSGNLRTSAIVAIGGLLALGLYGNTQIGLANMSFLRAQRAFALDPSHGMRLYQQAFTYFSPYAAKEKLNCAFLIVNSLVTRKPLADPSGSIALALKLGGEAAAAHPRDAAVHMILNDLYNSLALYVDRKYLDRAEAAGKRALELSPARQEAMIYLGRTYIIRGETLRAVELNSRMVELYPAFPLAHWFLGLSLLADNQKERAKQEVRTAIEMGYRFQNSSEADTVRQLLGESEFNRFMQNR